MKIAQVPQEVRDSIRAIVNYDWQTELRDYEENDKPEGHVFEHLQRVDHWLIDSGEA